ncbi:biotin-dependent carboxyltransferase family protein [Metabacillus sp. cB07]|uniref:5-oxoprolinase subunit C family protein n=1 Tax=Metabacillus sp. cB07 TaxID=2806989 RepID=UPI00193994F1|nr:biotin-dependent carboxyltransferase family protein [Metabacillus sp. cB07]
MTMLVKKPGLLTTVQDIGRYGYQKYGVIVSGSMDTLSHRIANLLVGNDEHEAVIEMTMIGARFEFQDDALISICGGDFSPTIDSRPVKMWRPVLIRKGSILSFGHVKKGCRAYLAAAGGYLTPKIMGSKSTYLRAGIGGVDGRALETGDVIEIGGRSPFADFWFSQLQKREPYTELHWSVSPEFHPFVREEEKVQLLKGRQYGDFSEESKKALFSEPFKITPQSDRMGYRLEGPKLSLQKKEEMISEAVSFGTIQVPSDGNPIILLADRQTTGGYAKIGQAASIDLPYLAQLKPGDSIHFKEISIDEAQKQLLEREKMLHHFKEGLHLKLHAGR